MSRTFSIRYQYCPAKVDITIGSGILKEHLVAACLSAKKRVALISDDNVAALHASSVIEVLKKEGMDVNLFTFPAGEKHKSRSTKEQFEDALLIKGYSRDTLMIGLGGGVTTDLVGFLAATFCRGIPYILLPTSLLAMVDASIGGKGGVNTPAGKNLIGSLYHPQKILMELDFLKTLPSKERQNGLVEMVKHGAILDRQFFDALHFLDVHQAISQSCQIKQNVVQEDENEQGKRRLLNFGHTVGHALEAASHYTLSHGEAVAIGMVAEARLAIENGYLHANALEELLKLYSVLEINPKLTFKTNPEQLIQLMKGDKKSLNSNPRFVMLNAIGSAESFSGAYCIAVEEEVLVKILTKVLPCYAQ